MTACVNSVKCTQDLHYSILFYKQLSSTIMHTCKHMHTAHTRVHVHISPGMYSMHTYVHTLLHVFIIINGTISTLAQQHRIFTPSTANECQEYTVSLTIYMSVLYWQETGLLVSDSFTDTEANDLMVSEELCWGRSLSLLVRISGATQSAASVSDMARSKWKWDDLEWSVFPTYTVVSPR